MKMRFWKIGFSGFTIDDIHISKSWDNHFGNENMTPDKAMEQLQKLVNSLEIIREKDDNE